MRVRVKVSVRFRVSVRLRGRVKAKESVRVRVRVRVKGSVRVRLKGSVKLSVKNRKSAIFKDFRIFFGQNRLFSAQNCLIRPKISQFCVGSDFKSIKVHNGGAYKAWIMDYRIRQHMQTPPESFERVTRDPIFSKIFPGAY